MLRNKKKSYTSPINALPSEVLSLIFMSVVGYASPHYSSISTKDSNQARILAQVCSRWRHITLDVCPIWPYVHLFFNNHGHRDNLNRAKIGLGRTRGKYRAMPIYRQPDISDTLYIQTTLATISPYIKQLCNIDLATDQVEQFQPFLDFWLEKGTSSLDELTLSVDSASRVFSEIDSHLSDRLNQSLRYIETLSLSSVGLDWSSVAFDRLTLMKLDNLPFFCCPTLVQLARILSTCPALQDLWLERIMIPASPDIVPPKAIELKDLNRLSLEKVDIPMVLSIISPGGCELDLRLEGAIDDINTLASLRSFANRSNIQLFTLTLLEERLDRALAQFFHSIIGSLPGLRRLRLLYMSLHESELGALANYPMPSELVSTTGGSPSIGVLELHDCTIRTTATVFHNAITALPWPRLLLVGCNHCFTTQGEAGGATEMHERIFMESDFGIELNELMLDQVDMY